MQPDVENAITTQMLATVTHDLLHTFQIIKNIASNGQRSHREATQLFKEIGHEAESGQRLLRQSQALQKDRRPRNRKHTARALRDALERLIASERTSHIILKADQATLKCVVNVDLDILTYAFRILLSNAIQHGESNARVAVKLKSNEDELSVEFQNNARIIHSAFDLWLQPFWTTTHTGAGLGLTLASVAVHKMHGTIVEKIEGTQVCVKISLPLFTSEKI